MTTQPQSSLLAKPLWIDSGLKNGTGVRELISTWRIKSAGGKMNYGTFPPKFLAVRISYQHQSKNILQITVHAPSVHEGKNSDWLWCSQLWPWRNGKQCCVECRFANRITKCEVTRCYSLPLLSPATKTKSNKIADDGITVMMLSKDKITQQGSVSKQKPSINVKYDPNNNKHYMCISTKTAKKLLHSCRSSLCAGCIFDSVVFTAQS